MYVPAWQFTLNKISRVSCSMKSIEYMSLSRTSLLTADFTGGSCLFFPTNEASIFFAVSSSMSE